MGLLEQVRSLLRWSQVFVNQKLNINGIPVTIYDTAGLRKSKDDIETEGNTRALNLSKLADIKIYIGANNLKKPFGNINIDRSPNNLVVINKSDLVKRHNEKPNLTISLKDNKSLNNLWNKINQSVLRWNKICNQISWCWCNDNGN